ncbi:MAG TPA: lysylphosphatidylglycerol synthase transmembrane domain-containing protein [Bacteroidales bacterium]
MKHVKNAVIYSVLLFIGLFLFWLQYRHLDWASIKRGLAETNYFWVLVSVVLSLLSHVSRAIRWKMLIKPLGYDPKVSNIFLSVMVLYFTNLIIPRGGEVARCTVLAKYEKIPASKLVGTMIVERIADTLTMMGLAVIIFLINISILQEFFRLHPQLGENFAKLLSLANILLGVAVVILIIVIFFLIKPFKNGKFSERINKIKREFKEGIKSILMLENKWYFIGHTLFIFLMWLLMLYVVFLAYPPTQHLTIWVAMFTFLMSGLAMLAPVQGGIGAWHFMVIESLFLFGINRSDGLIFALIAHSCTSLIYLLWGSIALVLFPVLNPKHKAKVIHSEA